MVKNIGINFGSFLYRMNIESFFGKKNKYSSSMPDKENQEMQEKEYVLHFDGCSKGNPGFAGAGAVIYEDGQEIYAKAVFVGENETNNVAEYTGLCIGLQAAIRFGIRKLVVRGDSQLVIRQILGEYKVKSPGLLTLFQQAKTMESNFESISYHHIYRDQNARADALSNEGLLVR